MISRLGQVAIALLLLLDGIACFLWLAPLYLVGLADRPSGHQLISAYVGRAAMNGRAWALRTERIINRIMAPLTGPDHCRRAARHYAGFAD
jgi:hypothetical protein